jgi:hypothetical protein
MPPYLETLLEKSFEVIPGESYNQYRLDVAEQIGAFHLFYEFSLMEEKPWRFLRDRVYPLFARYIKAKRYEPATGRGVVVAIFRTNRCYLLKGEDFLKAYREVEGLDAAAFLQRVQQWLAA